MGSYRRLRPGQERNPVKQFHGEEFRYPEESFMPELSDVKAYEVLMENGDTVPIFSPSLWQFILTVLGMIHRDPSLEHRIKGFRELQGH